ncbi:hypothetical protein DH2020_047874 [Rehmannia glutinosa]|uniref:J domain-containing protein n=1 Tax=Rehmannia glutinosa TaxID=99300 RepID=A0ABR0U7S0_REHGL
MVVDKAALEARERSYAEAREKTERAVVERATTEVRQRAMAERAVVERATAEARQRAIEKSMAQKSASDAHDRVEISVHDRFSASFRSVDTRQSSLSSVRAESESPQRKMPWLRKTEALDAEVRRWLSGKEGNLRALLSTLQYIFGLDSGWQPVLLTEVITSAAVKKTYRKATLFVHPDKLQQRGATIQQKYTCEKVFDFLKVRN